MKAMSMQSRVVSLVIAILLLLQISPSLAGGPHDAQLAITEGSRFPGSPMPDTENADHKHRRCVEVTFTKWVKPGSTTPFSLFEGFTGGDVAGAYVGEVLNRRVSQPQPNHNGIVSLEAMYEVQAGDRSFTALIRGGTNAVTGAALLDGVILAGWRTGARVHVEFQTMPAPSPTESGCAGAPAGKTCFQGTIHIARAKD